MRFQGKGRKKAGKPHPRRRLAIVMILGCALALPREATAANLIQICTTDLVLNPQAQQPPHRPDLYDPTIGINTKQVAVADQ